MADNGTWGSCYRLAWAGPRLAVMAVGSGEWHCTLHIPLEMRALSALVLQRGQAEAWAWGSALPSPTLLHPELSLWLMKATELKDVLENGRSGTRLAAEILASLCWQVCYFCLYPGHWGCFWQHKYDGEI